MAAQGEDTAVVNKNKRFRKDKRVTLFIFIFIFLFLFLFLCLCLGNRLIDCCFLAAWDTDDIDQ